MSDHRLGGERVATLVRRTLDDFHQTVDMLVDAYMADGYAPGTVPRTPREQYQTLIAWQRAQDPRYWDNPKAQAKLAELSQRYGSPPALQQDAPFGVDVGNHPASQLASYLAAAKLGAPEGV